MAVNQCAFCDKYSNQVELLIKERDTCICNECVDTCVKVLHEQRGHTLLHALRAAWSRCSEGEQMTFLAERGAVAAPAPAPPEPPPPSSEWQYGSHIDSLPTQPPLEENLAPVAEVKTEEADEGEPADWWRELTERKSRRV
jgi:ClpX C4-type zinc finger